MRYRGILVAATCALSLSGSLNCAPTGTGSSASSPAAGGGEVSEETWLSHRGVVVETAALVAQYVRHWEQNGKWPQPGTYGTKILIFKGTESGSQAFPNRRRDFYRTPFAEGRELDVLLYDDGRIEVDVLWDREPKAGANRAALPTTSNDVD